MASKIPIEHSAGGAVYKRENGQVLWLVQVRAGYGYWQIPKGHLEKGESAAEAAVREVTEESGITARFIAALSPMEYSYMVEGTRRHKKVEWFLMEYVSGSTDNFDPKEVSAAAFVPFADALQRIEFLSEKDILIEANQFIHSGDFQTNLA